MPTHIPAQDLEHGQDSIQRFPPSAQEVQITSMVHGHITFFNASLLFNYTMQKDAVNESKSLFWHAFELCLVFTAVPRS